MQKILKITFDKILLVSMVKLALTQSSKAEDIPHRV